MAVWSCADCTTDYAVGLPQCPQCGSVVRIDDRPKPKEDDVAKVTVHGGPSNAAADEEQHSDEPSETQSPKPARKVTRSGKTRTAAQDTE